MYAFVDRPIDDLCNTSRFMLWAMRAWTHCIERRMCPPKALASAFSHMGLLGMLPDFHMSMALFNRNGLERIALAPIPHAHVVEDEALLLALWRDASKNLGDQVRSMLVMLVDEDGVEPIRDALINGGTKLRAAGFGPLGVSGSIVREAK